ncbi:hypothetical protein COV16_06220 [Candidatus Woesearchaeota archaeon CG10_big_fil_rev_8_21_14_0_10_34_8]|nr:MAG: hypothetical protein COV16_06220 [Candidatus Woesearchaeota archaeon CG10_big_fil_rev_8_21_14_0_10_34_8]
MKVNDFNEQCGYCGLDFQGEPVFNRQDEKEYITFSCEHNHKHNIPLDMENSLHRDLIGKNIKGEKILIKDKVTLTIERKVRGKLIDLLDEY